jgi:hypothetical protein
MGPFTKLHTSNERLQVGSFQRVADSSAIERIRSALESIEDDFPDGMRVAERLRPLFAGRAFPSGCDLSRARLQ